MFCIKCGTELPNDAKFCYKCGNKIEVVIEDESADDKLKEEMKSDVSSNDNFSLIDREEQILQADKHRYMEKNPKTKKALLDILKENESIEYIVKGCENAKDGADGGAFIITNQRMMYIIRNMLFRNHSDKIYPLNTEIKQGKWMLLFKCIELGNEKYTFPDNPEAIQNIIDTQRRILGNSIVTTKTKKCKLICDIGTKWGNDKAQLYADNTIFEIRLKGHTPRQIPIDEIYDARAGKESTVDIYTKESIISMKVNDKNSTVATIQKYIRNLKNFNFDNNKEYKDVLPSIIKSDFPYDMDKSGRKINIIRKYDRLVAPIRFESFTEYMFFDVETLEKFDEKNFNSGRAALGWFLGGDSLKWGLSDKEYTLKVKLKSGYQCLVEAKDGMINITDIADISAIKSRNM